LTWPETYSAEYAIPGNDFARVVLNTFSDPEGGVTPKFWPGDEIFGMTHFKRASTWAEYAVVSEDEVARKPGNLTWEHAAALPLCALTAYEALFGHAGVAVAISH
jgi:NADPH2:quinone reductase